MGSTEEVVVSARFFTIAMGRKDHVVPLAWSEVAVLRQELGEELGARRCALWLYSSRSRPRRRPRPRKLGMRGEPVTPSTWGGAAL
jgi:hypothetical protein